MFDLGRDDKPYSIVCWTSVSLLSWKKKCNRRVIQMLVWFLVLPFCRYCAAALCTLIAVSWIGLLVLYNST